MGLLLNAVWVGPYDFENINKPMKHYFPTNLDNNCVFYSLCIALGKNPTIEQLATYEAIAMSKLSATWLAMEYFAQTLGIDVTDRVVTS